VTIPHCLSSPELLVTFSVTTRTNLTSRDVGREKLFRNEPYRWHIVREVTRLRNCVCVSN